MNLPFNLDMKSLIVGALFAMFIWPWIQRQVNMLGA